MCIKTTINAQLKNINCTILLDISNFIKISSVRNKITLKILWLCFFVDYYLDDMAQWTPAKRTTVVNDITAATGKIAHSHSLIR